MKNYLKYELKANILPIIVLTVMFMAIQILILFDAPINTRGPGFGNPVLFPAYIGFPIVVLIIASMIVPMFIFSYKNQAKSLDCLYGLPIKRQLLVLTKAIIVIIMVLIPWTIGYWTGVVVLAIRGANYNYIHYLTTFVAVIPVALLFIGFSSFLFTRANRNIDGAFFVLFGILLLMIVVLPIYAYGLRNWGPETVNNEWLFPEFWLPFFGVDLLVEQMNRLIAGGRNWNNYLTIAPIIIPLIFMILFIIAWFLLIFLAPKQKAEDAGSDSNSFYGYRIMIPLFTFMFGLFLIFSTIGWTIRGDIVNLVMIVTILAMVSFVGYVWFRRSFKIKKEDLIVWTATILAMIIAGVIVMLVTDYTPGGIFPMIVIHTLL